MDMTGYRVQGTKRIGKKYLKLRSNIYKQSNAKRLTFLRRDLKLGVSALRLIGNDSIGTLGTPSMIFAEVRSVLRC